MIRCKVLVVFAYGLGCHLMFLMSSRQTVRTAMDSFKIKCVFSVAGPITIPKLERLSLTTLASMFGGFLLTHESSQIDLPC